MDKMKSAAWKQLEALHAAMRDVKLIDYFKNDPARCDRFSIEACDLLCDYSKHFVDEKTIAALVQLAEASQLSDKMGALFSGEPINSTVGRAALHTLLRANNPPMKLAALTAEINQVKAKMEALVEQIHAGKWLGFTGKRITDVVNIGIGGSDLGPRMVTRALTPYHHAAIHTHFVANVDGAAITDVLNKVNIETTLFIVASKSFTTQETLANARVARQHLLAAAGGDKASVAKHFVAVSSKPELAVSFGIDKNNVFPMWDWVGGRYSLWSAIGLSIAIQVGWDNFAALLNGAAKMDEHFSNTPLNKNIPVVLGLLGVWYRNFFNIDNYAVLPYAEHLDQLPSYLQQLDMESNGKRVQFDGSSCTSTTGPVVWGSVETNGQHAFHQLLHQGTNWLPVDFIATATPHHDIHEQHAMLYANCVAQSQALMCGQSEGIIYRALCDEGMDKKKAELLAKHKACPGNRPSTTIDTTETGFFACVV